MTYAQIVAAARSVSLMDRITACAAQQNINNPVTWTRDNTWRLAAQPGWDAAWASAVAGGIEDPGANEGVITDGMILSAVQSLAGVI
jgi:hypothetical protein